MCGIAGYLYNKNLDADVVSKLFGIASSSLKQRGPDNASYQLINQGRGLLVHTRLSVIDLSETANQPMTSRCGRFQLVFNGEIYNYKIIAEELLAKGVGLSTSSDTEVLLSSLIHFGFDTALEKLRGMFAFALWDEAERVLTIARDRSGEKPLYYTLQNGVFAFASDVKALKGVDGINLSIDKNALSSYMRFNYVPSPYSIYQNVQKLQPGHKLQFNGKSIKTLPYWTLQPNKNRSQEQVFGAEKLENLLTEVIEQQMLSDVPLGAFLSGGVDSSLIVSLMQKISAKPVKTFTIGFSEPQYNEAPYARDVADHIGTDHTECILTPQDALDVIPKLADIYTEPFADASQIPTYLVSKIARRDVTVCLSGDAGDELFGGYNRYLWGPKIWRKLSAVPLPIRRAMKRMSAGVDEKRWNRLFNLLYKLVPDNKRISVPAQKLKKIESILDSKDPLALYMALMSHWEQPNKLIRQGQEYDCRYSLLWNEESSIEENMAVCDFHHFMTDDILVKVDRAAMANSLETRAPFLDHHVIEQAYNLPLSSKIQGDRSKCILRDILYKYVPKSMIERPKAGFAIPIDNWLRHDLKDWASDLLSPEKLNAHGLFDIQAVEQCWQQHLNQQGDYQYRLWGVLMFQSWFERHHQ